MPAITAIPTSVLLQIISSLEEMTAIQSTLSMSACTFFALFLNFSIVLFGILNHKIKIPIIFLNKLVLKTFNGRFADPVSQ